MIQTATRPGLEYRQAPRATEVSPLRSDVAGFIGRMRRGPVGVPVRVEGFEEFCQRFGGLSKDHISTYAIRGYFENEGQVAHVVRIIPDLNGTASEIWAVGELVGVDAFPNDNALPTNRFLIRATSPGSWANGLSAEMKYDANGSGGEPTLSIRVDCEGEPNEYIRVPLRHLSDEGRLEESIPKAVARQSLLIRIEPLPFVERAKKAGVDSIAAPRQFTQKVVLGTQGSLDSPTDGEHQYLNAATQLAEQIEVAIVATPSIREDLEDRDPSIHRIWDRLITDAVETQDRIVLIDGPNRVNGEFQDPVAFANEIRPGTPINRRAAAVYYPWLRVSDPLGEVRSPFREVPPSGHVAGVMSRIDRQRGAHHTPANVHVRDAVDIVTSIDRKFGGQLNHAGVNHIRCIPGKGLMIWGGRTLDIGEGQFLAHRRFIHRLIRGIRRVAAPVVFDNNVPAMWSVLIRSVSTIMLEAFRNGSLRGENSR